MKVAGKGSSTAGANTTKKFGLKESHSTVRKLVTLALTVSPAMSKATSSPRDSPSSCAKRCSTEISLSFVPLSQNLPSIIRLSSCSTSVQLRLASRRAHSRPCGSSNVICVTSWPLMVVILARTSGTKRGTARPCSCRKAVIGLTSCGWILIRNWLGAFSGRLWRQVSIRSLRTVVSSRRTIRPSPKATTWITLSRPRRARLANPYRQAAPAAPRKPCKDFTSSQPVAASARNVTAAPPNRVSTSCVSRTIHNSRTSTAAMPAIQLTP